MRRCVVSSTEPRHATATGQRALRSQCSKASFKLRSVVLRAAAKRVSGRSTHTHAHALLAVTTAGHPKHNPRPRPAVPVGNLKGMVVRVRDWRRLRGTYSTCSSTYSCCTLRLPAVRACRVCGADGPCGTTHRVLLTLRYSYTVP